MIKTCCFVGHRKIEITDNLKKELFDCVEKLIIDQNVKVFLFGSMSQFDDLCYAVVTALKQKYVDIKRVYVRSVYEEVEDFYKNYLLESFEDTFFPTECKGAGKLSYIKRNIAMIDKSQFCVFYCDKNYQPPKRKWAKRDLFAYQPTSGTLTAYEYAMQKKKSVINLFKTT